MNELMIKRVNGNSREIGQFINDGFSVYSAQSEVALRYEEFCYVAENSDGKTIGVIIGHAYYNEVHIRDLIIEEAYRRIGVGSRLVGAVENAFKGTGYNCVTLTTFGFQAPDFYKKLGYEVEFIRENSNPKLSKYFFKKTL